MSEGTSHVPGSVTPPKCDPAPDLRSRLMRFATRLSVVVGIAGLLGIGLRYTAYENVWGHTPCDRNPAFCDDAANVAAQRALARWYLGFLMLSAAGFLATLARRAARPRRSSPPGGPAVSAPATPGRRGWGRAALTSGALTVGVCGVVIAAVPFWLFSGPALTMAVTLAALTLLAALVDRVLRRSGVGDAVSLAGAALSSMAAATGVVVGAKIATGLTDHLLGLGSLMLVGAVIGAAVVAGAVAAVPNRAPGVVATGWVLTIAAGIVLLGAGGGRVLSDLHHELSPPSATARSVSPQVALAWVLAQGDDVIPIPGTSKPHRIDENVRSFTVRLSADEIATLNTLTAAGDRYSAGFAP